MHAFWLVLTYDLLENRRIDDVIIKTLLVLYYIKQIDSKLPCVCSVIDHRGHQLGIGHRQLGIYLLIWKRIIILRNTTKCANTIFLSLTTERWCSRDISKDSSTDQNLHINIQWSTFSSLRSSNVISGGLFIYVQNKKIREKKTKSQTEKNERSRLIGLVAREPRMNMGIWKGILFTRSVVKIKAL